VTAARPTPRYRARTDLRLLGRRPLLPLADIQVVVESAGTCGSLHDEHHVRELHATAKARCGVARLAVYLAQGILEMRVRAAAAMAGY